MRAASRIHSMALRPEGGNILYVRHFGAGLMSDPVISMLQTHLRTNSNCNYACMYVYIYIYMYILYIHIYTYTHILYLCTENHKFLPNLKKHSNPCRNTTHISRAHLGFNSSVNSEGGELRLFALEIRVLGCSLGSEGGTLIDTFLRCRRLAMLPHIPKIGLVPLIFLSTDLQCMPAAKLEGRAFLSHLRGPRGCTHEQPLI